MLNIDAHFLAQVTQSIFLMAGVLTALKRLLKSFASLSNLLSKVSWQKLRRFSLTIYRKLAEELTPPEKYPHIERVCEVYFAALFYVFVLDCTTLLIVDVLLSFFSPAPFWKHVAGFAVAIVIAICGRWCFAVAERTRIKLRANSRVIW